MGYLEYDKLIVPAYEARYPSMKSVRVSEVVKDVLGGDFVVVRSDEQVDHEEIAYVDASRKLYIFGSTEELVRFIQGRASKSLLRRLLTTQSLALLVFVVILLLIVYFGTSQLSSGTAVIGALGGVLTIIAGRLFAEGPAQR